MQRFDLIVPVGVYCVTSWNLRKCGLQEESLPFDWASRVTLESVIAFLENDFADFLKFDQLEFVEQKGKLYTFRSNNYLFPHDFHNEDPAIEYDEVITKYQRRIERLKNKIQKAKKILFVHTTFGECPIEDVKDVHKRMQALFPKKKIKILYLNTIRGKRGIDYTYRSSALDVIDVEFGTNPEDPHDWHGHPEVFAEIFKKYGFSYRILFNKWVAEKRLNWKEQFKIGILKFRWKMIKLLTCFIPSQKTRKQLRERYKIEKAHR